jgi:RNA-binding protein
MDSKTRASLKSQANSLPALYQIGKEGVTASVCAQVSEGFNTRELMKIKCLLKTLPCSVREAAEAVAAGSGAELVQTIGGSIILYKYNPELHKDEKKPAKPKKLSKGPAHSGKRTEEKRRRGAAGKR